MNSEGRSQGLAQGRSQKYVQNGTPDFYLLKQMAQFSLHKNHRIVYFIMFYYVAIVCESSRQHIFVKIWIKCQQIQVRLAPRTSVFLIAGTLVPR